jgi:SAM-dependent methyltransferase
MSAGMGEAFARAYKDGRWHHGSGSGSSPANTILYREFLARYMRSHRVRSVLDIGCGDWQFSRLIDWTGIAYTGIDVVPDLISDCETRYGTSVIKFACGDVLDGQRLPAADLILVKDLLQHWPDAAVHELGIRLAGRRALLTYDLRCPHPTGRGGGHWPPHEDTEAGGYRPLYLTAPPFSWPARQLLRYETVSHEGRVRRVKVVTELAP